MSHAVKAKCRNVIKSFVQRLGYDIVAFPKLEGPYEKIHVKSSYAPWKEDLEFQNCFSKIQTHSLVDKHRCYELWDMIQQSAKLEGALIEIGVWRGGTGALIAKRAELSGLRIRSICAIHFAESSRLLDEMISIREENTKTPQRKLSKTSWSQYLSKILISSKAFSPMNRLRKSRIENSVFATSMWMSISQL